MSTGGRRSIPTAGIFSAAHRCYWGFKVFQAARLSRGDYSKLVKPLTEGFAALVAEEAFWGAVDAHGLSKNSSGSRTNSGAGISKALAVPSSASRVVSMEESQRAYNMFLACDTDGDGWISRQEFVAFAAMLGETRLDYLENCFGRLDKDMNGERKCARCRCSKCCRQRRITSVRDKCAEHTAVMAHTVGARSLIVDKQTYVIHVLCTR